MDAVRYCTSSCWSAVARLSQVCEVTNIVLVEAVCVITKVVPCAMRWVYQTCYRQDMVSFRLNSVVIPFSHNSAAQRGSRIATLYFHNANQAPVTARTRAILFLHGDYSHPYSLFPLIDIAERRGDLAVFSLHMPYDESHDASSQDLVKQAIDTIESNIRARGGLLDTFVMAGHSKGGTQSAFEGFVRQDRRVTSVITIAGRVRCLKNDSSCDAALRPLIDQVHQAIEDRPDFPLYQIVPRNDWNAPTSAMAIRPWTNCAIIDGAMHLNVLYNEQTHRVFSDYLSQIFNRALASS